MRSALLTLCGLLLLCAPAGAADAVPLASLDLSKMTAGWGRPQIDKSIEGKPLTLAGKVYEHGVGTHARSRMYIDLKGKALRFTAHVGVDSERQSGGSVVFEVIADGRKLFDSGVLRAGGEVKDVDVDLTGVHSLLLLATDAGDGVGNDHADWAEATLLMDGAKPDAVAVPREEAVILTPTPAPQPRINGAPIFGVRPGSPFLFTVPATGDRPMTFAAEHLPAGLTLDAKTGQITGVLKEKGEYKVTLRASNAAGHAERVFRIVCGDTLALTPPMGWNSWYVWTDRVSDQIMRSAADAMVSTGLINHGFMYVSIDDCWAVPAGSNDPNVGAPPRDAEGRIRSNARFPDMKAMTDYIHARGLKAGIYTGPGPTTCAGCTASFQREAQDARRFAEWGFDLLKYDWCSYSVSGPLTREEMKKPYVQMSQLLRQQNRDILLNICAGGMGNVAEWGREAGGHSWRTADDLGGSFDNIIDGIYRDGLGLSDRARWSGPGGWNDPDYLLLGNISNGGVVVPTSLTPNEQYTQVSLWCMLAAPLFLSGDITHLDDFTLSLLSNDDVLELDQDALGKAGHRVAADPNAETEVWIKELEDGSRAVCLFNRAEGEQSVAAQWSDLGVSGKQTVRDLWRQKDVGVFEQRFETRVPRHGVALLRLRTAP